MITTSARSQAGGNAAATQDSVDDILYESQHTRVWRRQLADGTGSLICKEPLGPHALQRLHHEERILRQLADIEGISRLSGEAHPTHFMALQDSQGVSLSQALRQAPLALPELLSLALQLAQIIAAMHHAGVMHKDINPANILLCGVLRKPELIDFHLASTFIEEQPGFTHHHQIAGTLAYLAPE
ncbi:MAG: protein kinase, partial [Burkholderiaceae bacterium]